MILQIGPEDASLDTCRLRCLIDLEHAVKVLKVNRHGATIAFVCRRIYTAHNAGTAPEGNCRQIIGAAPIEKCANFILVRGGGDDLRRIRKAPPKDHACEVVDRTAVAVKKTIIFVTGAELLQSRCECRSRRS